MSTSVCDKISITVSYGPAENDKKEEKDQF